MHFAQAEARCCFREAVHFVHEGVDTSTANGQLVFGIFASIAEFERELIRDPVKSGLAAARARGKRLGRPRVVVGASRTAALRPQGASWREICAETGFIPRGRLSGRFLPCPKTYEIEAPAGSRPSGLNRKELAAVRRVLWAAPFGVACGIVECSLTSVHPRKMRCCRLSASSKCQKSRTKCRIASIRRKCPSIKSIRKITP